jgi:hypothetical protein
VSGKHFRSLDSRRIGAEGSNDRGDQIAIGRYRISVLWNVPKRGIGGDVGGRRSRLFLRCWRGRFATVRLRFKSPPSHCFFDESASRRSETPGPIRAPWAASKSLEGREGGADARPRLVLRLGDVSFTRRYWRVTLVGGVESDDGEAISRIEEALSGAVHPIGVCRWLVSHRDRLSIDEWDPLMCAIRGVVSDTDDFDVDEAQRALWNPEALDSKDSELAAYLERSGGVHQELRELLTRLRATTAERAGARRGDALLPELSVVRLLVEKVDDAGRAVPAGSVGAIVHVHDTRTGTPSAYIVEVVISDASGAQVDAHILDVTGNEIEPAFVSSSEGAGVASPP